MMEIMRSSKIRREKRRAAEKALNDLGERESGMARGRTGMARLEEAVAAYRAALAVFEAAQACYYVIRRNLTRAESLLTERRKFRSHPTPTQQIWPRLNVSCATDRSHCPIGVASAISCSFILISSSTQRVRCSPPASN